MFKAKLCSIEEITCSVKHCLKGFIRSFKGYLKNFVWEDQRGKPCYISHIALGTRLECYIANIAW